MNTKVTDKRKNSNRSGKDLCRGDIFKFEGAAEPLIFCHGVGMGIDCFCAGMTTGWIWKIQPCDLEREVEILGNIEIIIS
jgi:hypothetical protein